MCRLVSTAVLSLAGTSPAPAQTPTERLVFPLESRWIVAVGDQVSTAPIVAGGRVFFTVVGQEVDALALDDGAPLWWVAIDTAFPPVAGDGLIFVATPDGVAALDQETGAERWRARIGAAATAPTWRAGWLVAVTDRPEVVALRAADGAVIWRARLDVGVAAAPALEGDRLYLPLEDGRVVAREIETGGPVWEAKLGGAGSGIAAFADRVYVGSLDNRFYCLAARNGHVLWDWRTGADVIGGAVVDAERVYFVSLDNVLYALDRRTGVRRWKAALPNRAVGPPSPAGPAVLIPVSGRTLLFAPRRFGRPLVRIALPADLFAASAFDATNDVMVVTVTVDASGQARLEAFGHAPPLPLEPLAAPPGLGVGRPVPLVTTALPFQYLALPAPPRRGASPPR